ncbi:hypothetical protein ACFV0L_18670 [Streptosporangium canum]|uniref:hypothetical protein n=1 Tax=Streptosporangium canum TaxID=324952 RepID=UPI0036BB231D
MASQRNDRSPHPHRAGVHVGGSSPTTRSSSSRHDNAKFTRPTKSSATSTESSRSTSHDTARDLATADLAPTSRGTAPSHTRARSSKSSSPPVSFSNRSPTGDTSGFGRDPDTRDHVDGGRNPSTSLASCDANVSTSNSAARTVARHRPHTSGSPGRHLT